MKRRSFLSSLGLGFLAGRAAAQEGPPADPLAAVLAESKAPALAGAVITASGLSWIGAQGVRRAGSGDAVTVDDRWHLGSNTKAMTAAVYARLVEQGKAKWGATVPELFPGLRIDPAWSTTTVEALMSHRSGVSDRTLIDTAWLIASRTDPRPLPEQRRALAARAFGKPPAGKSAGFEYSNANYILLGAAIERIAGDPWEAVIRRELFEPLGMASAGFGAPQGAQPWGHGRDGAPIDPAGVSDNPAALGPAGTVHASLTDYAKFLRLFLTDGGGFLSADSIARLTAPASADDQSYALGWGTFRQRAWARGPALAHEGSNTLWHVLAVVGPKRGIAIVTASNDDARGAKATQSLALKLIQAYAPA
jgi:CubicO group peptidase (beta-lactamase class C family)